MDEKDLGRNMSSGAEKVESIERRAEIERQAAERRVQEAREKVQETREKKNRYREALYEIERQRKERQTSGGQGGSNGENRGKKQRGDGLGGWIAAVVSLGTVSLILSAVLTVGAINMSRDNATRAGGYRGIVYEVIHIAEQVDDDLDTLRISEDPTKQMELLTDILVQTRMAEADLEKLPYGVQEDGNTMRFLNGMSDACERMLGKLARGEGLSIRDKKHLEMLYETQHKMRETLDELAATLEDGDVTGMMKGKDCRITEALEKVENEATPPFPTRPRPPKREQNLMPIPSGKEMQDRAGIPSKKAEELCRYYFADYGIESIVYAGETLGSSGKTYNFEMTTENGVGMFAQLSQENGALTYFDYYEECSSHVYDVETAKNTAWAFLEKLGYTEVVPVKVSESGTNADFTFVYYADGCTYYPDEIIVKVCEQRGVVSGMDATKYIKNHRGRCALNAKISMQEARDRLSDKLTVESSRMVLFNHKGEEMAAYEFFCSYDGKTYFVYLDANDGRELFIVNSRNF